MPSVGRPSPFPNRFELADVRIRAGKLTTLPTRWCGALADWSKLFGCRGGAKSRKSGTKGAPNSCSWGPRRCTPVRHQPSSHPCRRHRSIRLMTADEAAISAGSPRYAYWAYHGRLASAGPRDFIAGKHEGWKIVITGPPSEVVPFTTLRQRVWLRTSSTNSPHPNSPSPHCVSSSDSLPFFHVCRCECRCAAEPERWSRREVTTISQWLLQ